MDFTNIVNRNRSHCFGICGNCNILGYRGVGMINVGNVYKVYSGRRGCMCGCKGKYSYTAKGAVDHSPGYDVTNSINERSVKIITTKVLSNPNKIVDGDHVYVEQNDRILVAFFAN
jgi:hypothetical protein